MYFYQAREGNEHPPFILSELKTCLFFFLLIERFLAQFFFFFFNNTSEKITYCLRSHQ